MSHWRLFSDWSFLQYSRSPRTTHKNISSWHPMSKNFPIECRISRSTVMTFLQKFHLRWTNCGHFQPFSTSNYLRFQIAFPWLQSTTNVYQSLVIHSSEQGLCIYINLIVKQKGAFASFSCCLQDGRKEIFTLPDIKRLTTLVFSSSCTFHFLVELFEAAF